MKRKFLVFSLALLANASVAKADILTWNVGSTTAADVVATLNTTDSTLTVSGTGAMQNYGSLIRVPYLPYRNCIKTLAVEEGVTSLGDSALARCSNLVSVSFPSTLTELGAYAFAHCTSLNSVNLSESLTTFNVGVFNACYALQNIEVASENPNYSSENGVLFNKNKTVLRQYPAGKQGAYSIPEGVTSIGNDAFWACYRLTGITIPNTVTIINAYSFYNCTGLTSAVIPNSVITIDFQAFFYCTNLSSIVLGSSLHTIGHRAFLNCFSLRSIVIPASVSSMSIHTFSGCLSLTSIEVEDDNLNYSSENGVFFDKNKTTILQYPGGKRGAYSLPESVENIGIGAFTQCNLTSLTINSKVTSIGQYAFESCTLSELHNRRATPQQTTYYSFELFAVANCMLYVPFGSATAYKEAYEWKEFAAVKEDISVNATDHSAVIECVTSYSSTASYKLLIYTDEAKTQILTIYNIPTANVQNNSFTQNIENLQSATKYWFDIQAISSRGATLGIFSDNFTTKPASGIADVLSDKTTVFVTNGQLIIQNDELEIKNVAIYDLTGKIIFNSQFSTLNSIDVSTLTAGVYLLKIQTGKGVITKKFVK
jgi:hypothetical protein